MSALVSDICMGGTSLDNLPQDGRLLSRNGYKGAHWIKR
jgi:hypothetical protein